MAVWKHAQAALWQLLQCPVLLFDPLMTFSDFLCKISDFTGAQMTMPRLSTARQHTQTIWVTVVTWELVTDTKSQHWYPTRYLTIHPCTWQTHMKPVIIHMCTWQTHKEPPVLVKPLSTMVLSHHRNKGKKKKSDSHLDDTGRLQGARHYVLRSDPQTEVGKHTPCS